MFELFTIMKRQGCVKSKTCADLNTLGIHRGREHCSVTLVVGPQHGSLATRVTVCNSSTIGPPNYMSGDIVSFFFFFNFYVTLEPENMGLCNS